AVVAVVREGLSNAARHAAASRVEVRVTCTDHLTVRIRDDGVGIAPEPQRSSGLRNLTDRAEALGGTLSVEPGPSGGTLLVWSVPLT
ncbi:MAG: sensor histidine kinase, partial [Acidimicrobiales bacterium]